MKKLAFLLALIFVIGSMFPAFAQEEPEPEVCFSGDFVYVLLKDGTAEIVGYAGEDGALEIPATLDGYAVTSIGTEAFSYFYSIESVTIPDSVASMGGNPFQGCEYLTTFNVSPGHPALEVIDGVLFSKTEKKLICYPCSFKAESYAIPEGTLAIGENAFHGCETLVSIEIPDSVTEIGSMAFASCYGLTGISIPNGVTALSDWMFSGCENLSEINIPENLASIGHSTFFFCSALTEITIPESVTAIGSLAFENCGGLTGIRIPDSVVSMDANPFLGCANLTEISISPEHPALEMIDGVLFDKAEKELICYPRTRAAESYAIPEGTLSISSFAFCGNRTLTEIEVPGSVKIFGNDAFSDCEALTAINLSEGLESISENAFLGCRKLGAVTIPAGVTTIGEWAFSDCEALTAAVIPASVTAIGESAFTYCAEDLAFTVAQGSFAEEYAKANGIPFTY